MSQTDTARLHPRELDLARHLKDFELDWNVQTGDWFFQGDRAHIVLRVEQVDGRTILHGMADNGYDKDDVLWLPHRTSCIEWLMHRDWELAVSESLLGKVKASAKKRHTDFRIEKTEPTELAAIYAVMLEVLNLMLMGSV